MVKWFEREHVYKHPWERVTLAFWKKYPNPLSPQVQEIEVIDRHVDEQGRLFTTRLLTCRSAVPEWIASAVGGNHAFVLETSMVDTKNKILMMKSKNLSYPSLISVEETCTYLEDNQSKDNTRFIQEAKITVPLWGVSGKVEDMTVSSFQQNAKKGTLALETICQNITDEKLNETLTAQVENLKI